MKLASELKVLGSVVLLILLLIVSRISSCVGKHNDKMARWEIRNPSTYKAGNVVRSKLMDTRLLVHTVKRYGTRWRYECKYIYDFCGNKVERTKWIWEHEIAGLWDAVE